MRHVTMSSGQVRQLTRNDADDRIVTRLIPIVRGGGGPLGLRNWALKVTNRMDGAARWQLFAQEVPEEPWIICITCWSASLSRKVWDATMNEARGLSLSPTPFNPAQVPWTALITLSAASILPRTDTALFSQIERCIAWALIDAAKPA